MINYFLLSVILSGLFLSASILDMRTRRMNYYFSFIHFAFFLANCGYLGLALSTNLEQALTANKATYIGGCFGIMFVMLYKAGGLTGWQFMWLILLCLAVTTADGPGTALTSMPLSYASRTSTSPGSDMQGIPASVTTPQSSPARMRSMMC